MSRERATCPLALFFPPMEHIGIEPLPLVGKRIDTLSFAELRTNARDWYYDSGYWKSQFERAKDREEKKDQRIAELEAEIRLWKQKFFGKKSEGRKRTDSMPKHPTGTPSEAKKGRGHQPGTAGNSRRTYDELDVVDEVNDLSEDELLCSQCGLPAEHKGLSHTTEIVEIEVKGHKRRIVTPQYHKGCKCPTTSAMISAPPPDRVIKGNNLGVSVWTELLLSKFYLQQPLSRVLKHLTLHGLDLPVGTVTDGFRRIEPLFEPIMESIKNVSLQDKHWHADETRWSVFITIEGKIGHRWYLWVYRSEHCIYFQLEPSRATKVPLEFFPEDIAGILSVDRYSAYKCLVKSRKGLTLSFCWAHARRDFIDAFKKWPELEEWTTSWLSEITELYTLNTLRISEQEGTEEWKSAEENLRKHVSSMEEKRDDELALQSSHSESIKVLESLKNHWEGLTVFLGNPHVPLDNNPAEQSVRGPAVGRKNYYGSGATWSARLAASLFSIFGSLDLNGISQQEWLRSYLSACAQAGGRPPDDLSPFTPWIQSKKITTNQPSKPKNASGFP